MLKRAYLGKMYTTISSLGGQSKCYNKSPGGKNIYLKSSAGGQNIYCKK